MNFEGVASIFEREMNMSIKEESDTDILYRLTNSSEFLGAVAMLYDGVLEEIGNKLHENFYILPSSIHEVLIVPESASCSQKNLMRMVKDVNQYQVDAEEVLSYNVYYYDRETEQII